MASDQLCYNRGCGQRFNPEDNKDGLYSHIDIVLKVAICDCVLKCFKLIFQIHAYTIQGLPFFMMHTVKYMEFKQIITHVTHLSLLIAEGWSCCKKKCTDFTEFLNIKVLNICFYLLF